jgi:hypothetical protein
MNFASSVGCIGRDNVVAGVGFGLGVYDPYPQIPAKVVNYSCKTTLRREVLI